MRLARTAAPLPRVALQGLAGWSRTSGLRFPKPAGWPSPPQPDENPRRDSNPRFRAENPASLPLDHGGMSTIGGPGIEPGPARYQRAVPPRTPTSDESSGGR